MLGCSMRTFPLFRSVWWYAYHVCLCHPSAFYASLHACLHIHAWVLLASVSSVLQNKEAMDIRSKPTFVPCGHYLLFAFLLVCLFTCLLAFLLLCLPCLSCLSALCLSICFLHLFLPLLAFWFLFFAFECTHGVRMLGVRAQSPKHKQKGRWGKHVNKSQAAMFSRFSSLALPFWFCTL